MQANNNCKDFVKEGQRIMSSKNGKKNLNNLVQWRGRCRLCAKDDSQGSIDLFSQYNQQLVAGCDGTSDVNNIIRNVRLRSAIDKYFGINILYDDGLPRMLCIQCYSLVTSWVNFATRVAKVKQMFEDLQNSLLDESTEPAALLQLAEEVLYIETKPSTAECEEPLFERDLTTSRLDSSQRRNEIYIKETMNDSLVVEDETSEKPNYGNETENSGSEDVIDDGKKVDDNDVQADYTQSTKYFEKYAIFLDANQKQKKAYKCPRCYKLFSNRYKLANHTKTHFNLVLKKSFPCRLCGTKFAKPGYVQKHIHNIHSDERPFKCTQCGKTTKSRMSLKSHMLTHTDSAPFKCDVCQNAFKTNFRLKRHMETHDSNTHVCPECGKQLSTSYSYTTHMKRHLPEPPQHKCDYCGRVYPRTDALKYHLLVHIGVKPYCCNFCKRTFATGKNCHLHQQKHHSKELADNQAFGGVPTYEVKRPTLKELRMIAKTASNLAPAPTKRPKRSTIGKRTST